MPVLSFLVRHPGGLYLKQEHFKFIFPFITHLIFTHLADYESEVAASVRGLLRSTLPSNMSLEIEDFKLTLVFRRKLLPWGQHWHLFDHVQFGIIIRLPLYREKKPPLRTKIGNLC